MNVIKYRVSLDMFDTLSQTKIKAKKCDSACQIHITLTGHGKIYKIGEGCYATFNAKKSDGTFVYDKCSIEGNTIVYDFGASIDKDGICQVSACEGIVECEVTLYNAESHQLTSPRFTLFIDGTVYNGEEIISTPEANVLKELINETNNLINDVETRLEKGVLCITGEGAPTSAIKGVVGSLYMDTHTHILYKCIGTTYGLLKAGPAYTTSWDEFGPARFKIQGVEKGDTFKVSFDFAVNLNGITDETIINRIVTNDERILWPVFRQYNADGSAKAERILELKNSTQGTIGCTFKVNDPNEFYRIIIRSSSGLKDCWELSNFTVTPTYEVANIGSTTVGSNTVYDAPINLDFSDGLNYWLNVGSAENPKVIVEGGLPIWKIAAYDETQISNMARLAIQANTDQTYSPESENAQSGKAVAEVLTPLSKAVFGDDNAENMLFDSSKNDFVYGESVTLQGAIYAESGRYRMPMIDISDGPLTVKLNYYNASQVVGGENGHNLWIAQYDQDKNFISGSRVEFWLTSGNTTSYDLRSFIGKTPAIGTIIPNSKAKYAVLFNFFTNSVVDIQVYKSNIVVEYEGLLQKVSKLSEIVTSSILFDNSTHQFVYDLLVGPNGELDYAYKHRCRTPLFDISGGTVTVTLNSYNGDGAYEHSDFHNLWIVQYDENKNFISGSRKEFPLSNGSVTSYDLLRFQGKTPAKATIKAADGAKYAVLSNFFVGATIDIQVTKGEKSLVDSVQKLEEGEKSLVDRVQKLEEDDKSIVPTKPFIGSANIPLITTVCGNSAVYSNDFSALIVTDMHGKFISLDDAALIRDTYAKNTPILNMGDMVNMRAKTDGTINSEVTSYMEKAVKYGVYHTMGQHEVGWSNSNVDNPTDKGYYKSNCMSHDEVFNTFIAPMKSVWGLNDLTTNYYYKDFTNNKMRLISLYQYNIPLYDDPNDSTKYKYMRSSAWLGQEQLQWLINTLESVPEGYRVVIMMHQCENSIKDAGDNSNFFAAMVSGSNNIISGTPVMDIVQAYINKTTINKTYKPKEPSKYTESDFTVTVSGDFTNAKGKFANFITGDSHQDSIGYAGDTTQRVLGITSSNQSYDCVVTPTAQSEHRRIITLLGYCYSKNFVKVGRIGQQYSLTGQHRVIEKVTI